MADITEIVPNINSDSAVINSKKVANIELKVPYASESESDTGNVQSKNVAASSSTAEYKPNEQINSKETAAASLIALGSQVITTALIPLTTTSVQDTAADSSAAMTTTVAATSSVALTAASTLQRTVDVAGYMASTSTAVPIAPIVSPVLDIIVPTPVLAAPSSTAPTLVTTVLAAPTLAAPVLATSVLVNPVPATPVLAATILAAPDLTTSVAIPALATPVAALAPAATTVPPMPGVGGSSKMREIRERSKLRRQLVAQQLGVYCPDRLGEALGNTRCASEGQQQQTGSKNKARHNRKHHTSHRNTDLVALYTDSTTFLKGTQSANPHNDYCQHFVDTGHRPQNFIRDVGLADRFEEYPKLRELIKLKDDLISATASPPCYLKADLHQFPLASLHTEFDVILVEPPLEEYQHTAPGHTAALRGFWDWNQIRELDIAQVAAPRSFIFLWVGSSEGLDEGRRCLRSWGFRRCEDICWIRTNSTNPGHLKNLDHKAVFQRTKEHCLMGIKGTVRRSSDGDFIHANVDIDLIITEERSSSTLDKPVEIFHIIEHFCLGKRRLHLFGRDPSIRPGWLTVGPDLSSSNFDPALYSSYFNPKSGGNLTTGCTERIEALRPKSPPPKPGGKTRGGYIRGRGRGR